MSLKLFRAVLIMAVLMFSINLSYAADTTYDASKGLYPEESGCLPWNQLEGNSFYPYTVTTTSELIDGNLVISSNVDREVYYYSHDLAGITLPETIVMEATLKVDEWIPDLGHNFYKVRGIAALGIDISTSLRAVLNIQKDSFHLLTGGLTKGEDVYLDTDDDFHTYRLEVNTSTGESTVYYDGELVLTGGVFSYGHNNLPFILWWGDGTNTTAGTVQWRSVSHNAAPYACDNTVVDVPVDIKPRSCPNPLNLQSKGVISVAIAGTDDLDVGAIDPGSINLAGAAPIRYSYEDVTTPYAPYVGKASQTDCTVAGADGLMDLVLKFDRRDLVDALELSPGDLEDGTTLRLGLAGFAYDGTGLAGEDVIRIIKKGK